MIVDMMRNDLGRIARCGSVQVSDLFRVERYPTLWQMTSCVSAETGRRAGRDLRRAVPLRIDHGGPESQHDADHRPQTKPNRGGSIRAASATIAPGRRARFNVAIRTVLVDKARREAEYGVGGGVVWDSTPQGEYDECLLKARILSTARPEFSLLETLLWTPGEGYFCLREHLRRLRESAEYFAFPRCDETAAARTCRPGREAAGRAAQGPLAGCPRRQDRLPGRADPRGEFPDPVRLELAAAADRRGRRVPLPQDDPPRGLRRGAGRLPRGRRRAALQSAWRGHGDHPRQYRGPLRQGSVDAAGVLRPAAGDLSRPAAGRRQDPRARGSAGNASRVRRVVLHQLRAAVAEGAACRSA